MFVVFEGIDGGGKTTLSNLVAAKLRTTGLRVVHVREGGTFASSVTQALRELGRDSRNLALAPRAELMLYLTREVQLADEVTRPALLENDVVIADRYVYTAEALAVFGRRMAERDVTPLVRAASAGLEPDVVVLVDVEPAIARARRRVSKIIARDEKPPSRKGLAGTALQRALRDGYRTLAERDPARWLVVDNTDADLEALADSIAAILCGAPRSRIAPAPRNEEARDHDAARAALLAWIDRRAVHEPGLAAYMLDGTSGPGFDERRVALAARAPAVIAAGLNGLDDAVSWQLRRQLVAVAPYEIATSLAGPPAVRAEADVLLSELVARSPSGVGRALYGRDDAAAWALRERLTGDARLVSLREVASARAWTERESWLSQHGAPEQLDVRDAALACISLTGLDDDRAWELRKALRGAAPVAAIESLIGLVSDRAWKWRNRYVNRAPKSVMRTLVGVTDPRGWPLRERVAEYSEEVLDTIIGDDTEQAWSMREAAIGRWPASVLKSLGVLAGETRGRALVATTLARHPSDVSVWRQAVLRVPVVG